MPKAYYIDYKTMKDFYTLKDAVNLLSTTRPSIERLCYRYGIALRKNSENKLGSDKTSMIYLHSSVYHDPDINGKIKQSKFVYRKYIL